MWKRLFRIYQTYLTNIVAHIITNGLMSYGLSTFSPISRESGYFPGELLSKIIIFPRLKLGKMENNQLIFPPSWFPHSSTVMHFCWFYIHLNIKYTKMHFTNYCKILNTLTFGIIVYVVQAENCRILSCAILGRP